MVFDGEGASDARVAMAPDYKANRAGADYSHLAWLPTIYEGLRTIGLEHEETSGAEADDVIAELVRRVGASRASVIVSTDRDFLPATQRSGGDCKHHAQELGPDRWTAMKSAYASALNPGSGATTWPWSGTPRTTFRAYAA